MAVLEKEAFKKDLLQKVAGIIAQRKGIDAATITGDENLADLGINSIDFVQIVVELEDMLDCEFDDDMLSPAFFKTINDFINAFGDLQQ
ncbi:MAG: acyl carrier protein [Clostridia bacterium]|nr:acyl carrier protein [Clostridia bacterium]